MLENMGILIYENIKKKSSILSSTNLERTRGLDVGLPRRLKFKPDAVGVAVCCPAVPPPANTIHPWCS
jgi:hypothetical protein